MKSEPVLTVSAVVAAIGSLIGVAVAFGAPISDEQRTIILEAIPGLWLLIGVGAAFLRGQVASPDYVARTQAAHLRVTSQTAVPADLSWPRKL